MDFKKRLLILIGVPSAISLFLIIGIFYLTSDISKLSDQIYKLRKDINFGLQAADSLPVLRQDYEQTKIYLSEIGSILPNKNELLGFSKDLNTMAKQNQINLNLNIGQESPRNAKKPVEIDLSVAGQGTFENLLSFLKTVENSRYFIKFNNFDFQQDGQKSSLNLSGKIISL